LITILSITLHKQLMSAMGRFRYRYNSRSMAAWRKIASKPNIISSLEQSVSTFAWKVFKHLVVDSSRPTALSCDFEMVSQSSSRFKFQVLVFSLISDSLEFSAIVVGRWVIWESLAKRVGNIGYFCYFGIVYVQVFDIARRWFSWNFANHRPDFLEQVALSAMAYRPVLVSSCWWGMVFLTSIPTPPWRELLFSTAGVP